MSLDTASPITEKPAARPLANRI
ncbi:MAG: hypothetical protein QOC69_932, partial [Mycobacterium sp.]|nr:hypothetical protein [Mycobacterium sp.]